MSGDRLEPPEHNQAEKLQLKTVDLKL